MILRTLPFALLVFGCASHAEGVALRVPPTTSPHGPPSPSETRPVPFVGIGAGARRIDVAFR